MDENTKIAELSRAVRASTLKRLRLVPEGFENWRPSKKSLSFADIVHHLIEADRWLFRKFEEPDTPKMVAQAGEAIPCSRREFLQLIDQLAELGEQRSLFLESLNPIVLNKKVYDDRFDSDISVWWLIMRGNLDHEAHHRGQIASYLRLIQDRANESREKG
jgi:uncharacterized damage-inducible protein DinB